MPAWNTHSVHIITSLERACPVDRVPLIKQFSTNSLIFSSTTFRIVSSYFLQTLKCTIKCKTKDYFVNITLLLISSKYIKKGKWVYDTYLGVTSFIWREAIQPRILIAEILCCSVASKGMSSSSATCPLYEISTRCLCRAVWLSISNLISYIQKEKSVHTTSIYYI